MRRTLALTACCLIAGGCKTPPELESADRSSDTSTSSFELVPASEVDWEQLNPARGDRSPLAGTLWGDRGSSVPTGFLARFIDGFSSPPHLHNVTYRAVVIHGSLHNDDPGAAELWMPPGSFWTQPKGEVHITAAQGDLNVALVEIDEGPYLVLPPEEAFESSERAINVVPSNLIWLDPPGMPLSESGPKIAYLWGQPQSGQSHGVFVRLPPGFKGEIRSNGHFRTVVIRGQLGYREGVVKILDTGSYFSSNGERVHPLSTGAREECVLYCRSDGTFDVSAPSG